MKKFAPLISFLLLLSCGEPEIERAFVPVDPAHSQLDFNNLLTETDTLNYFIYPYLYLGGGVATGDINSDGLADIFFTGNMVDNKLFVNKGNWKFEDIADKAGVKGGSKWYTGVTMCDVNEDGWLDIYLSVSGKNGDMRNELYINNQDETFTEAASSYGIADGGASIQSVFLDYDLDGDLDLYVANYPATPFNSSNLYYKYKMDNLIWLESDHLYENRVREYLKMFLRKAELQILDSV